MTEGSRPLVAIYYKKPYSNRVFVLYYVISSLAKSRPAPFSLLYVTFDLEGVERTAKNKNHQLDAVLQDAAVSEGFRDRNRNAQKKESFF